MSAETISVVIQNKLYDLTSWAPKHPGGAQILRDFNNKDATDYFYAIHSKKAGAMMKNMRSTDIEEEEKVPESNHSKLMKSLEAQGYFKPKYGVEFISMFHTIGLCILAVVLNDNHPLMASLCLGFGFLTALWVAHSMEHSRDSPMQTVGHAFSYLLLGYSPTWWSAKHTRHHLSTNEVENDGDIQLQPFIFLYTPSKKNDIWNRSFQHVYFSLLYSLLHAKWKFDSLFIAIKERKIIESSVFLIHYIWMFTFQWRVHLLSVLICGTLLAWIVSSSHQAEEKIYSKTAPINVDDKPLKKYQIHDYAQHQIITTRNINIHVPMVDYMCGGMQYQIEHHLFPRMPLYNLPLVKPIVKEFCKENGFEYKEESIIQIWIRNYKTMKYFADLSL